MFSGFEFASRNKRELSVARDLGFDVLVCDYGTPAGPAVIEGFQVERRTRNLSRNPLLRRVQIFVDLFIDQPRRLRGKRADVISGHDLLGLGVAWLSTWFVPKNRRPKLVYDAHEFSMGQQHGWRRHVVGIIERFLIKRSAFSIMVNDSIAERVQEVHGLDEKPVVVRNTPSMWVMDEAACAARREGFRLSLGMPSDAFFLMYHGGVIPNRGVEVSIRALVGRESVALIILGNGDATYTAGLRRLAEEIGVIERVLFHEAVPLDVLGEYVGAADAGVVLLTAVCENHLLALPNKFFENVQSLTPVIASDFPEIGSLVRHYDIGLLVDPEDSGQVGEAVDRLRFDRGLLSRMRSNLLEAKADLCWEKEKERLVDAYSELLR